MATLQQKIVNQFLASLASNEAIRLEQVERLRVLLEKNKKPKADFCKAFHCSRW